MLSGLHALLADPAALAWLFVAVPIGMAFGAVPGLGGKIALIAVMPFIAGMDLLAGCVFLISLHAVVHTGAAAPTIMLGIPGTGPSTAVVADGHAMARRGEAVRALAASALASGVGGLVGTLVLALIVPFALALMQLVSYPEIFLLTLFGIGFSAVLSGDSMLKGLTVGAFGLLVAFVGVEPVFGTPRFTLGSAVLGDGIHLVTAVLALYAIPEMLTAGNRPQPPSARSLRAQAQASAGQVRAGLLDVLRHRWLTLRCSVIGALVGIIPGLGGDVAAWLCYGHAAQTSKRPEQFGKGTVEGVIGPEAANNSKEGGALVPTLFLGIPGSSGMAILLVALVPLGVSPGPGLLAANRELVWAMVWALALSNLAAAAALILLARPLNRIARLNPRTLVPHVYLLAMASVYISTTEWRAFLVMGGLALLGYALMRQNWPRAPFVIGLILGAEAEDALIKSLSIWGPGFLARPVSVLLIVVLFVSLWHLSRRLRRGSKAARRRASPDAA
ncbi:tripartite tricarboxylate transporter permease [Vannielia litorea]|uniref:TctA family transporter n=1 Tax=Vannielia litorea TaxID=1217970 RepID=A0A1N6GHK9_9RHOB|nr:tripartite tricarboxylate transporter permease [Vannielia litorea]SIO07025.1 TctA family transporter [Vannielia litorea]